MKENQIMVVIKEVDKPPRLEPLFDNTLESFQKAVGGYIETVTIAPDVVLICNEEGRIIGLPHNGEFFGVDFCGTVLAVGVKGEEFASLKAHRIPLILRSMGG